MTQPRGKPGPENNVEAYHFCPRCGERLVVHRCKLVCTSAVCKYLVVMSCADV